MAKKIKNRGKTEVPVRNRGKRETTITKDIIAMALGAGTGTNGRATAGASPHIFFVLRKEIEDRLHSSGGRPRLKGTTIRPKIPLSDEDWDLLKEIADLLRRNQVMATPGQVASILVHNSLSQIDLNAIAESLTPES